MMEALRKILPEGLRGLVAFVPLPGLVVEMARSLDGAVLQMVGPGADLAGTAFRQRDEI